MQVVQDLSRFLVTPLESDLDLNLQSIFSHSSMVEAISFMDDKTPRMGCSNYYLCDSSYSLVTPQLLTV